jgi:pimeloyl-ACP methyl ester carboxylesterase
VTATFTASHRGGSGPPLVCLHGITDTWRTWELVLPELEKRHDVLAPTLLGHAGAGPRLDPDDLAEDSLAAGVEAAMDEAGFEAAHLVGNSLGGWVALQLAVRGRALSVVAFAPAGGWAPDDPSYENALGYFTMTQRLVREALPHADALLASEEGRRRVTATTTVNFEHIPSDLLLHQLHGVAACEGLVPLVDYARREGWSLDAERIECPVRIVWGAADRLLRWPRAAARFREEWLPDADWVVLDEVGHLPQMDVPLRTAELVLGLTGA